MGQTLPAEVEQTRSQCTAPLSERVGRDGTARRNGVPREVDGDTSVRLESVEKALRVEVQFCKDLLTWRDEREQRWNCWVNPARRVRGGRVLGRGFWGGLVLGVWVHNLGQFPFLADVGMATIGWGHGPKHKNTNSGQLGQTQFGQAWFWPNLVSAKLGFGQRWFGKSWP